MRFRAVVDELVQLVSPACQHRKVELAVDCPAGWNTRLSADAGQLRQTLLNLVLNAVEAAGPRGRVRIELRAAAGQATVRIYDSGPGPPPQVADRLFEPFATGKPEGIGLGLTVARQIAEAHGGSLTFKSDGGTCFCLTLPLDESPPRAAAAGAAESLEAASATAGTLDANGAPVAIRL